MKGILGLAYKTVGGQNTVLDNMFNQGLIARKAFSFWLDSNQNVGSQLFFGGSDSKYYTGSFTYANVTKKGFWQFKMTG